MRDKAITFFFLLIQVVFLLMTGCIGHSSQHDDISAGDLSGNVRAELVKAMDMLPGDMDSVRLILTAVSQATEALDTKTTALYYNTFGVLHWYAGDYDSAMLMFNKTLSLEGNGDILPEKASAANNTGALYNMRGEPDSARKYMDIALQIDIERGNEQGRTKTMYDLALLHLCTDQYLIALKYITEVLAFQQSMKDSARLVYSFSVLGDIKLQLDSIPVAISMFKKSSEIAHKIQAYKSEIQAYNNIAAAYVKLGSDPDSAIAYARKGLELSGQYHDHNLMLNLYLNIGAAYSLREKHEQALRYYLEAFTLYDSVVQPHSRAKLLIHLADEYVTLKQMQSARQFYQSALQEASKMQSLVVQRDAYLGLAHLDSLSGNFEAAFFNYQQGIALRDSISNKEIAAKIIKLQYLYNLTEKEAMINKLEQKDSYNRLLILSGIIIFAVSGAGVLFFMLNLNKRRKISQQQLIIQQKEMEKAAAIINSHKNELTSMASSLLKSEKLVNELQTQIEAVAEKSNESTGNELNQMLGMMKTQGYTNPSWREFEDRFNQVGNNFFTRLHKSYPSLSPSEIRLCGLIRLQLSSKEIAEMSHRSLRTIEYTRNNIRKKMGLKNNENLAMFLLKF